MRWVWGGVKCVWETADQPMLKRSHDDRRNRNSWRKTTLTDAGWFRVCVYYYVTEQLAKGDSYFRSKTPRWSQVKPASKEQSSKCMLLVRSFIFLDNFCVLKYSLFLQKTNSSQQKKPNVSKQVKKKKLRSDLITKFKHSFRNSSQCKRTSCQQVLCVTYMNTSWTNGIHSVSLALKSVTQVNTFLKHLYYFF